METERLQAVRRMVVKQRLRLTVNQYEISAPGDNDNDNNGNNGNNGDDDGELIAFVQQKRLALRERVTFWTDSSRATVLGGFAHRDVIDLGGVYDVTDADGGTLGHFRRNLRKSLFRTTWHLEQPGLGTLVGTERSGRVAALRRIWAFVPFADELPVGWAYHFDFQLDGAPALSVTRARTLRDRYRVEIHEPRLDRRLVIAMAVALDAMQSR
ncbi:hypothetical protein FH609_006610 [Streptomyces sp. 3MP-14]|uniref:Scramblase n=2 Tax=Streptomyces TaxID=1883 RepID=A0A5N6AP81_9ACTN|nr:hypothetical protein FH607_004290 [Streptomyces mimosae]KAB8178680.1 hypothetical protein FH609_006610 [Streptomyces sp. 3MP-14]